MFSVKARMAWVSVLALVLSAFVPLQTAPATAVDTTFTKTFTVTGVDGQPYAGAQVALIYTNHTTQSWTPTTPVTTNSSGVATVTASSANSYVAFSVQPPVTDTTTALYTSRIGAVTKSNQAISVQLVAANMRVNIVAPGGSNALAGAYVGPPSDQVAGANKHTITLRAGAFGIAVSTTVTGDQEFLTGAASDIDASNRILALRMTGTGDSASRVLYSDDTFTSTPLSPVSGVYQIQLRGEEINGVLRNAADTSNITLPAGVQGRVVFTPAKGNGSLDRWYQGPKSSLFNSNGTFTAGLPSMKPGKYFSQILIGGSATLPSFTGPEIWVDATGKYSMTQNGSYETASSFVFKVLLPATAPNLVVRAVSSTGAANPTYLDLEDENNQGNWWGPNATSNGVASYVLDDGSYFVRVNPFDSNEVAKHMGYRVLVDGSSIIMRNDHNGVVAPVSAGNYTITTGQVNVRLQVNNPNTGMGLANSNVEIRPAAGDSIHGYSNSGTIERSVPNGTYNLQVTGGSDGTFATKNYEMVVASGGVTVSEVGGSAITPISGYVPLTPNLSTAKFKIMDPRTNSPTVLNNASVDLQSANGDWIDGSGTWDTPVGLYFEDGVYTLQVQGFNASDLASARYSLTKAGSTITLRAPDGTVVQPASPGVYEVFPSRPNITFVVKHPSSPNGNLNTGSVEVFNASTNNWVGRSEMNNGVAGLSLVDGRYNVRVNPGDSSTGLATGNYNLVMASGVSTLTKADGTTVPKTGNNYVVYPQSANVTLLVKHPTTQETLSFTWVNVFMLDEARNSRDWVTNGQAQSGPIGLSLADGHYALQVNDGTGDTSLAAQRYELTVSNSGATVVLKTWSGTVINPTNGALVVSPQGANLLLRVVNPDSPTQPLRQSHVQIRDTVTGEWLSGNGVNNLGQLGLNVDPGTYEMEVHPGNQATGLATKKYNLVIANDRSATLTPVSGGAALVKNPSTSVFDVTVAAANVKFNIVSPSSGHALLEQAWVNMFFAQGNNRTDWVGNSQGSHPGFALANGNYIAEVNPGSSDENLASRLYKVTVSGANVTVTTMAGVAVAAETNGTFSLEAAASNVSLAIVDPADATVMLNQSYVNIHNRDTNQWVAGTGSNRGLVSLSIAEGSYWIEVNPGNSGSGLASKKYNMDVDSSGNATISGVQAQNGLFVLTVNAANLKLKIVDPNDSTKMITNAYVNVQRDNEWIANAGGNSGRLALRLEDGTYSLQVDPGQQAAGAILARKTYAVTVSGGVASIQGKSATAGVFTLEVATPAISGLVKKESDSTNVPNSWVVPTNTLTNEQLWQLGANSNSNGAFGIAVPDGSYSVTAQVPWNSGYNLAKSAPCSVTVAQGAVTTSAGGCVQSDKSVILNLRAPNLTFILADSNGAALPNANVSIQFGAWNIWAQANDSGQVSLFIDPAEIKAANPNVSGPINLSAYLDPPYGNSDVVRSQCTKGNSDAGTLCAQLRSITLPASVNGTYTAYETQDLGTVRLAAPNTKLTVKRPDGSVVGAGAWVTVFKTVTGCEQCREYVASSNTSSAGVAAFNIVNPEASTYIVEVNAPNNERGTLASKTYYGKSWAQVNNQPFELASPNLKVTVKQPNGTSLAKWTWVGIETLNGSNQPNGWIGGSGTNDQAVASLLIPDNGSYRLTFHPGGGSAGARTSCDVTTNGSVVSLDVVDCANGTLVDGVLTLTLSLGNLTGTVTRSTNSATLAGAIVRAEWAGDINNSQPAQTYTTAADGKYGFQLAPGAWKIKTYYVNDPDSGFTVTQNPDGDDVTISNSPVTHAIVLVG